MRILHVVTAFPRAPDDPIMPWLVELLRRLRETGHDVEVFTSAYRGGGPDRMFDLPVHRFRYFFSRWEDLTHDQSAPERIRRHWRYRPIAVCYVVAGMLAMRRLCRRRRYDIVHVHWAVPHALFGWVARRACGARIVTTYYGAELRLLGGALRPLRRFQNWTARMPDRAVAISRHTADAVRRLGRVDVPIIPYSIGFDAPESRGAPERGPGFRVLFVGRLIRKKGVAVLVEALHHLAHLREVEVVIVGDGPEAAALGEMAARLGVADRVSFRGWVSPEELQHAYRTADAFVLPAVLDEHGDTEGLGVVLLEAMHFGVPVVASALGGVTDIVDDERTGLLVPAGDARALAQALERLVRDRAFRDRLAQAGLHLVRDEFGWPAITAKWDALYRELGGTPARTAP